MVIYVGVRSRLYRNISAPSTWLVVWSIIDICLWGGTLITILKFISFEQSHWTKPVSSSAKYTSQVCVLATPLSSDLLSINRREVAKKRIRGCQWDGTGRNVLGEKTNTPGWDNGFIIGSLEAEQAAPLIKRSNPSSTIR